MQNYSDSEYLPPVTNNLTSSQINCATTSLVDIPPHFFRGDFNLSDEPVWNLSVENLWTQVENYSSFNFFSVEKKLMSFIDHVETLLLYQIASKFKQFFWMCQKFTNLNEESVSLLKAIATLRNNLRTIKKLQSEMSLRLSIQFARKSNLTKVQRLLKKIANIKETFETLKMGFESQTLSNLQILIQIDETLNKIRPNNLYAYTSPTTTTATTPVTTTTNTESSGDDDIKNENQNKKNKNKNKVNQLQNIKQLIPVAVAFQELKDQIEAYSFEIFLQYIQNFKEENYKHTEEEEILGKIQETWMIVERMNKLKQNLVIYEKTMMETMKQWNQSIIETKLLQLGVTSSATPQSITVLRQTGVLTWDYYLEIIKEIIDTHLKLYAFIHQVHNEISLILQHNHSYKQQEREKQTEEAKVVGEDEMMRIFQNNQFKKKQTQNTTTLNYLVYHSHSLLLPYLPLLPSSPSPHSNTATTGSSTTFTNDTLLYGILVTLTTTLASSPIIPYIHNLSNSILTHKINTTLPAILTSFSTDSYTPSPSFTPPHDSIPSTSL